MTGGVAQRVVLGVMAALGVANVFMMRYCLSIAITAMVRREPTVNSTLALIHPQFECPYDTSAANSTPAGVSVSVNICPCSFYYFTLSLSCFRSDVTELLQHANIINLLVWIDSSIDKEVYC